MLKCDSSKYNAEAAAALFTKLVQMRVQYAAGAICSRSEIKQQQAIFFLRNSSQQWPKAAST
jgi:hypothetical protein